MVSVAQNGPKMRFFHYQKSVHGTGLIFWMNLQQHKDLKLGQMVYMGNIILDPEIDPK